MIAFTVTFSHFIVFDRSPKALTFGMNSNNIVTLPWYIAVNVLLCFLLITVHGIFKGEQQGEQSLIISIKIILVYYKNSGRTSPEQKPRDISNSPSPSRPLNSNLVAPMSSKQQPTEASTKSRQRTVTFASCYKITQCSSCHQYNICVSSAQCTSSLTSIIINNMTFIHNIQSSDHQPVIQTSVTNRILEIMCIT